MVATKDNNVDNVIAITTILILICLRLGKDLAMYANPNTSSGLLTFPFAINIIAIKVNRRMSLDL